MHNIGFMQGRLTSVTDGIIQQFPVNNWQNEILKAPSLGFNIIEWTIDYHNFKANPLMSYQGRDSIQKLCNSTKLTIPSVTCDCFMQMPFWKTTQDDRELLLQFYEVCISASHLGTKFLVVPLVDNGSIQSDSQEKFFIDHINSIEFFLKKLGIHLLFESDYSPKNLTKFINKFSPDTVGLNYDIGNSAAMGYLPEEELGQYGHRVLNIHVKDRKIGGPTVPLLQGDANFNKVFTCLNNINYQGDFILQTARSSTNNHIDVLLEYKTVVENLIGNFL